MGIKLQLFQKIFKKKYIFDNTQIKLTSKTYSFIKRNFEIITF